jgi:hypothetical protein
LATKILHRNTFRNTASVQTTSQLILQGSITRIAQDAAQAEARKTLNEQRARLQALESRACLVSPSAMESLLLGMLELVDKVITNTNNPDLASFWAVERVTEVGR